MSGINLASIAEEVITHDRLQRYGSLSPVHLPETIAKYLWNMALCGELYTLLNALEVALRNRLQSALADQTGKRRWWDPKWNLLHAQDLKQVQHVINRLAREKKSPNIGRVVSGMTLGFWVSMFASRYEQVFWKGAALTSVFPNALRRDLSYPTIRARLARIRFLRNRVFHHEPIWNWTQLERTHNDISEIIGWLSPDLWLLLKDYDEFEEIFRAGYQPYLPK